ncbi:hypothetical protein NLG97_g2686 [Lecanicillium saksenae]|uniref:Uncharacterized protein n=1 Tax=Lecanicillium saksenae TaxID=468837 RepID=A0ACC1R3H2_9HYPO|nr:hypothetical protein NLG97_g2686 [Lecanicillium saksenae]
MSIPVASRTQTQSSSECTAKEETNDGNGTCRPSNNLKPPDGGWRAWSVVGGAWCASFCSFGWINSIGEFQRYYQADLLHEYSPSQISWIPSLQVFFMMGMGPLVGILYDRFGPRYLLLGGTILHVFGLLMLSISKTYAQILLSQGVCSAIGVSAILQPSLNVIPGWFDRRRGTAFGILATGSSVGGVIFSLVVNRLSARLGFGWAIRVCALLILFLMAISSLTIKAMQLRNPRPFSIKRFYAPLTEIRFLHLFIGLFLFTFGFYIPMNYIAAEATFGGAPAHWATYLVPILNATSLCGRIGSGLVSDKIGKYNVFIIVCYLTSIFSLGLWTATKTAGTRIAFTTLFGLFSGAYVTLLPALVHQISPAPEIGLRLGLVYLGCSVGGLTTNPIAGILLESKIGWLGAKIFAGLMCFFGTSFVLAARWSQSKRLAAAI